MSGDLHGLQLPGNQAGQGDGNGDGAAGAGAGQGAGTQPGGPPQGGNAPNNSGQGAGAGGAGDLEAVIRGLQEEVRALKAAASLSAAGSNPMVASPAAIEAARAAALEKPVKKLAAVVPGSMRPTLTLGEYNLLYIFNASMFARRLCFATWAGQNSPYCVPESSPGP